MRSTQRDTTALAQGKGWAQVKSEFVRTDFQVFVDAAILLSEAVEKEINKASEDPAKDWSPGQLTSAYDQLHPQIERLLVATAVTSTFLRWLSLQRPALRTRVGSELAKSAYQPLRREHEAWRVSGLVSAILLVGICSIAGYRLRLNLGLAPNDKHVEILETGVNGPIVFDPGPGPIITFIVRF